MGTKLVYMAPEDTSEIEFKFIESEELAKVDYVVDQQFEQLTDTDHRIWQELYDRQLDILRNRAAPDFFDNMDELEIEKEGIPNYNILSDFLKEQTGWTLVPVPGLIPGEYFFKHLAEKRFPVTNWIRSRDQMDYIVEPDAFHDVFAHVPMIAQPEFSDYLQQYGQEALKALEISEKTGVDVLERLARVYWFTVEFGLINTDDGLRIYGAGIQSSKTESIYSLESPKPKRVDFDLERVARTQYDFTDLQKVYFPVDSYEDLLYETKPKRLQEMYDKIIEDQTDYENDQILENDKIIPPNEPINPKQHFY